MMVFMANYTIQHSHNERSPLTFMWCWERGIFFSYLLFAQNEMFMKRYDFIIIMLNTSYKLWQLLRPIKEFIKDHIYL